MLKYTNDFVENSNKHKILTPDGYEDFLGVNKIAKDRYIHLIFSNGKEIKCSEDHPFLTSEGIVRAKELTKKIEIETKDGLGCFVLNKRTIKKRIDLYDIVNSGKKHLYYTNDIISHNCSFLGSTNTLISSEKLAFLAYKEPLKTFSDMVIYEDVINESFDEESGELVTRDHIYVLCVDVSEGKNLDYSAFSVIDISTMPYRQVAVYRNNAISPMLFPNIIKTCAEYYNKAYVLVEVNNNPQIAMILHDDLQYENVMMVASGNKQPQRLCMGSGRNVAMGLKMTPLVKRLGCSNLKTLVENDKLIINDFTTISELTTFVQFRTSYSAEEGCNDDLAMTLIIFSWLATEKLFKDIVDHDIRKQLQLEHFNYVEEETLPVFQKQVATNIDHFIEDNCVWVEGKGKNLYDDFFNQYFKEEY